MCMENKAQKVNIVRTVVTNPTVERYRQLMIRFPIFLSQNCDDWIENGGQSANKMNSAQDGNNNKQDKRRGY